MTTTPNTTPAHLLRAYEIGKRAGLRYIYPGNIPGAFGDKEGTHCPTCDTLVIGRSGFRVTSYRLIDGQLPGLRDADSGRVGRRRGRSGGAGFRGAVRG